MSTDGKSELHSGDGDNGAACSDNKVNVNAPQTISRRNVTASNQPDSDQSETRQTKESPTHSDNSVGYKTHLFRLMEESRATVSELKRNSTLVLLVSLTFLLLLAYAGFHVLILEANSGKPESVFIEDHIVDDFSTIERLVSADYPEEAMRTFVRGYARMRDICILVALDQGWRNYREYKYDISDPLTGTPNNPYFCVNSLLSGFAGEETLSIHERQRQKWDALKRIESYMPSDTFALAEQFLDALSMIRKHRAQMGRSAPDGAGMGEDVLLDSAEDPTYVPMSQVGYLYQAMLRRDIKAIAMDPAEAKLFTTRYQQFHDLARKIVEESNVGMLGAGGFNSGATAQSHHCVCGPHLSMARSVVISISPQNSILFLEPRIVFDNNPDDINLFLPEEFPWLGRQNREGGLASFSDPKTPISSAIKRADLALREILQLTKHSFRLSSDITVESISVSRDAYGVLTATDKRNVRRVTGEAAQCVQYCHQLAYSLMDASSSFLTHKEKLII